MFLYHFHGHLRSKFKLSYFANTGEHILISGLIKRVECHFYIHFIQWKIFKATNLYCIFQLFLQFLLLKYIIDNTYWLSVWFIVFIFYTNHLLIIMMCNIFHKMFFELYSYFIKLCDHIKIFLRLKFERIVFMKNV